MASNTKHKNRPLTAMQRGMSDIISYEDILIAQYMNQIEKSPPTRKAREVLVSPYSLATKEGKQTKSKRPKSAVVLHHEKQEFGLINQSGGPYVNAFGEDTQHASKPSSGAKKRPTSARSRSSSILSGTTCTSAYSQSTYNSHRTGSVTGSRMKRSKPLYKKQPKVICIQAFQNGKRDNFARVTAPDLMQLLDNCTSKLGLVSAARKLYFSDGTPIRDARQIEKDADVYVSCGEAFKDPYAALRDKDELRMSASWTLTGISLPENKSRGKTKSTLSKRMRSLVDSQKRRILVFRNGESAEGVEIVAARFDEFLDDSTTKLKLESGARRLFDWEGQEIKSFTAVPVLERILQPNTTTVLGPVWVTKGGEVFSPKGAYNFLLTLLTNTKERLQYSRIFKEQLHMRLTNKPDVQSKEVMSMTDEEVHIETQQVDEHIAELSSIIPTLKKRMGVLRESVESEAGTDTYKYQHISEINADSRLLGKQGLRLKVYENGSTATQVVVYFNLAEAEKGIHGDLPQLMHRFLDTCTGSQRVGDGSGGPAGRRIAKRVFARDGTEVTSVYDLQYDQEIWLSYGEDFKPLNVMVLQLTLDKATCMSLWDEVEIVQREALMEDEKGKERPTAWKAIEGFPPASKRQLVNVDMPGQQRLAYAQALQQSSVDERGCFLQSREKTNMVLYPELIVEVKKKKGAKDVWPADAQEWIITQGGLIFNKAMPQLALGKSEQSLHIKLCDETVNGYAVHFSKRSSKDSNQQWGFSPTGKIYCLAKPNLFLSYIGEQQISKETMDSNSDVLVDSSEMTGQNEDTLDAGLARLRNEYSGQKHVVALLPKLTGKHHNTGLQRWAIKQEDLGSIGQWKHTTVANPEWNKRALSWPVTEDGTWNTNFSWPMEGFLLPFAPPVKKTSERKPTQPGSATRLRVIKNGESDESKAVIVVGPDMNNMWHDVNANAKANKRRLVGQSTNELHSSSDASQSNSCHPLDLKKIELELFLDRCTDALSLPFAGRKLFDEEGHPITYISDLSRDQLVYVSCGEPWVDPQMSYSEQQRRTLLMNLASDIACIRQYCVLKEPTELVLKVQDTLRPGAKLVVESSVLSSFEKQSLLTIKTDGDDDQQNADQDLLSPRAELLLTGTAHARAHQRSEERLKSLRWSWENEKTSKCDEEWNGNGEEDFDNEVSFSDPHLQKKFRLHTVKPTDTKPLTDPMHRQQWHFSDGFIQLKKNSQLVIGLDDGLNEGKASNQVVLCKKNVEDPSQRWTIAKDSTVALRSNIQLVLTVSTPPLSNDPFSYDRALDYGYHGSAVIVSNRKSIMNGNSHQLWSFDRSTGLFSAFASDTTNKEITAANKANVCTYAILGAREVYQPGYAYMPGTAREVLLCEACGRSSRGKNRLQRLKESERFSCAAGTGSGDGISRRFPGCFKCLNSKVDLSTLEAESTLELWEYQLDRLRNEESARTISKELNVAKSDPAVRILAHKNGEGSKRQGVLIIGSSMYSLLDQATTRLGLTKAARRLYTVRGDLITDIHQLVRPYNIRMIDDDTHSTPNSNSAVDYVEAENRRHFKTEDMEKSMEKLNLDDLDQSLEDNQDNESGNGTYRLAKGRTQRSLPTVVADSPGIPRWDTRWPIDVWVTCGEPFVHLEDAEKQHLLSTKHREERTWVQAYLDMEKHVLRQMQGRRIACYSPPQSPTALTPSRTDPTRNEEHKEETINELKLHLQDVKSRQKNEEAILCKSAKESTQRLYSTPKTLRVRVFPNGETAERSLVVFGASIREICEHSTARLDLSSAARRLFKVDGQEVLDFDDIRRNEMLCVSCGDNFIRARDRRHQMELKANWSRMARHSGGTVLLGSETLTRR